MRRGSDFARDGRSLLIRTETGTVITFQSLPSTGQALIDLGWQLAGGDESTLLTGEQRVRFNMAEP